MASDASNQHNDVKWQGDAGELVPSEVVAVDDATLLEQVVGYYHRSLVADAAALKWLDGQGLSSTEAIEYFRLGLANRTLGPRLSKADRKTRRRLRSRLQQLGLLRPSGHEHLNGCIVVPLVDAAGRVVELYGRRFGHGLQSGAKRQVWTSDAPHGLLSAGAVDGGEVIVTASIFGALRLWAAGRRNVTALSDIEGSVSELCRAVAARRTRRVVLVLPQAAASDGLAATLREAGVAEVQCVQLPERVAANNFVSAVEDGLAMLGSAMEATDLAEPEAAPPITEPSEATEVEAPSASPTLDGDELVLSFADRRWRVRGLSSNKARGTLRVNILVSRPDAGFHVDVLDVCIARQRNAFVRLASQELCADELVVKKDMGQVLLALELAQDELLRRAEEPRPTVPVMTEREKTAALELLRDSALLDRVLDDLERLGVVGERTNLLLTYLVSISRKLPAPLGVIVQSSSASGKSSLVQSVLSLVPDEDRMSYSMMTGQSLYYMGATSLHHKVLSIAEDRGVARASYALKLLQSEGALQIATTSKDPASGRLASEQYRVEGPIALMLTTTAVDLDEELLSRCLVLAVDESPQQTRRIHEHQRAGCKRCRASALASSAMRSSRCIATLNGCCGRCPCVVPIGERALLWLDRYLDEVRPSLVVVPDKAIIFLTNRGTPLDPMRLTNLMRRYIQRADLGKSDACHIFRHAMATLMLERGADIRIIQEILGHAELSTTEIYTRVSIAHLKAVHDKTHPGAKLLRAPGTASIAGETEGDDDS